MSLVLELERERYQPGDWIRGAVVVQQGGPARTLEVFVLYQERTEDYTEAGLTGRTGPLHRGDLVAGARLPFALQLPPDAPPPYRSRWGELYWEVDAKADRFGADLHARRRIVVAPAGMPDTAFAGEGAVELPADRTTVPVQAQPPAGWYADPWLEKRLRWWDGRSWTGHTSN